MNRVGIVAAVVAAIAIVSALIFEPLHGAVVVLIALAGWLVHTLVFRRFDGWSWWLRAAASVGVALVVVQLIPYGRDHTNPPVIEEPAWDSVETRELAVAGCFDCHSNETEWPWYTSVAPVSWIIQRHVDEGRGKLNFSEWNRPSHDAEESAETVRSGEMPLTDYLIMHREARLSGDQKRALAAAFDRMFGGEGDGTEPAGDD